MLAAGKLVLEISIAWSQNAILEMVAKLEGGQKVRGGGGGWAWPSTLDELTTLAERGTPAQKVHAALSPYHLTALLPLL